MNYLDQIGERIRERIPNRALPEEDTRGLFRAYAVLVLAKGDDVTSEDVHNAWAAWKACGEPEHPSIIPFSDLEPKIAEQDAVFAQAIRAAAGRLG